MDHSLLIRLVAGALAAGVVGIIVARRKRAA